MSEMLKTMLNRIEHNKNALKTKRYYVEDLISNEELIILVEEIKRLNNIINELEHYLKLEKWKSVGGIHLGVINGVLNKLQELKGSDKVE